MADPGDALEPYRDKRDFDLTPEPAGPRPSDARRTGDDERPAGWARFVIQKHAARRLHYDFRLETDGVMPSWAVPKGPSHDPKVRRLAVHVEDHPLDYRTFEGKIPGGAYGAGAVIVWDEGIYRNDSDRDGVALTLRQAIDKGHIQVWLVGQKLRGGWHLIRTAGAAAGRGSSRGSGGDDWLLIKRIDDEVDITRDVTVEMPASVLSGRTLEEVSAEEDEVPEASPAGGPGVDSVGDGPAVVEPTAAGGGGPKIEPAGDGPAPDRPGDGPAGWMAPMLARAATLADLGNSPGDWLLERKLDGLRCVAVRSAQGVQLWSRNQQSYTARFPEVVAALAALPAGDFTIDGELVAYDAAGRTSFGLLQSRLASTHPVLVAFDLIHLLGRDVTALPTDERRALLTKVVEVGPSLHLSEPVEAAPDAALADACEAGWEGLVAKRRNAPYRSGRSPAWCKLKCNASQELVIGGWTEPQGARHGFGALLVGYYDQDGLRYAGKVGTGFDARSLQTIYQLLTERETGSSPFFDRVVEARSHWAVPDLVAVVSFTEWTAAGRLRHPSFGGLRYDKEATEVRRDH